MTMHSLPENDALFRSNLRERIAWDSAQLAHLCANWRIRRLELFGSVLREDFRPESDIDMLVTFDSDAGMTLFSLVTLEVELATVFGRAVDVVDRRSIERSPNYIRRREILRDPVTIHDARSSIPA